MWTNQQHTKDLGDKRGQFSDWNRGDDCHILYCADLWKHCDWADWVCGTGTDAACMFVSADLLQTYHGRYQDSAYRGGKREKSYGTAYRGSDHVVSGSTCISANLFIFLCT